ncbi:MAG: hypothetical protein AVDCRST_MAG27-1876, partial [uncultured Craurococcus sp.]
RPGDQHGALHQGQPHRLLRRLQHRPPHGAAGAPDHGRGRLPGPGHDHLACHVRPCRDAGGGAGHALRRAALRHARRGAAPPLRRAGDRAGDGGTRLHRLPPPLPGRGGRPLAAHHPGGRGLCGL